MPTVSTGNATFPTAILTQKVTPTPSVSSEPTVKPTGAKKSVSLTVAVLNGSGTKGAAKSLSTALSDAGYTVSRTGNADAFTYTGVTIQIKKSDQQALDQLKKDLSAKDYLVSKSSADLAESTDVDAVIILGSTQ
jgi:hypothetical protein